LALDREVVMIIVTQLPPAPIGAQDIPPTLSDLRLDEQVEPMADVVMLLHRVPPRLPEEETFAAKVNITVAKNRNGPTGMATLAFHASEGRFDPLSGLEDTW
jgi:replicative DNA helicase